MVAGAAPLAPRGRHVRVAERSGAELARDWWRRGRWWYLPLLLSDYGRELDDADWHAVSGRLEALARLIWEFSCRQARVAKTARDSDRPSPAKSASPAENPGEGA